MSRTETASFVSRAGVAAALAWAALLAAGAVAGLWKLVGISVIAFIALAGGAALGDRSGRRDTHILMIWSYGLASGAMITSACVFLLPSAVHSNAVAGGYGLALGIFGGFLVHAFSTVMGRRARKTDPATVELTLHALAAGCVIGLVYAGMPGLGLTLGVAIVSHKGPAGYAAGRRLSISGGSITQLLLPASAVGLAALPVGLIQPQGNPVANALIFGFATGIFLHVAIDFLPERDDSGMQGTMRHPPSRLQTCAAPLIGGLAVFLAWHWLT